MDSSGLIEGTEEFVDYSTLLNKIADRYEECDNKHSVLDIVLQKLMYKRKRKLDLDTIAAIERLLAGKVDFLENITLSVLCKFLGQLDQECALRDEVI